MIRHGKLGGRRSWLFARPLVDLGTILCLCFVIGVRGVLNATLLHRRAILRGHLWRLGQLFEFFDSLKQGRLCRRALTLERRSGGRERTVDISGHRLINLVTLVTAQRLSPALLGLLERTFLARGHAWRHGFLDPSGNGQGVCEFLCAPIPLGGIVGQSRRKRPPEGRLVGGPTDLTEQRDDLLAGASGAAAP